MALYILEKFFWNFCDNYIEIVKHRLYRPEEFGKKARYSGQKTNYMLLYKLLQDFSVFFPFITEEIYQELYHDNNSIHLTKIEKLNYNFENEMKLGNIICEIISNTRGVKTTNNVSLKTPIKKMNIEVCKKLKEAIEKSIKDFKATLFIDELNLNIIEDGYVIKDIKLDV